MLCTLIIDCNWIENYTSYARFFTLEGLNCVLLYYAYLREIYSKFMSVHLIQYAHSSDCCFVRVNYYLMVYDYCGHCIIIFSFEFFCLLSFSKMC